MVKDSGPSLLGRDWLKHIRLDWYQLNFVRVSDDELCENVVLKNARLFDSKLGHLEQYIARFEVDSTAEPKFYKARPVAYAQVEAKIDRLQSQGVIELVAHSDWAISVVPVVKPNGSIRFYVVTISSRSQPSSKDRCVSDSKDRRLVYFSGERPRKVH